MLISSSLIVLSLAFGPAPLGTQCNDVGTWGSTCSATSDGSQVDVGASLGGSSGGGASDGGGGGGGYGAPEESYEEIPECMPGFCGRENYDVFVYPTVSAEDLVSFRPAGPSLDNEPSGFAVVGLPTNVYAAASAQTLNGELLGFDVAVRFVPVGFEFDYGDGSTATSATGGETWSAQGATQFAPTETGHTYRQRGWHTVTATVVYEASVDWGHGWRPVTGNVRADSGAHPIEVLEARTALVERSCAESPGGPGC